MTYFVIIRGSLGIGKSTIAKRLAKILHAEYVPIDSVLWEHRLDKIDKSESCIPAENFIKADEIMLPYVKEKLKNGKIVIFDACFYHKKHIEHLIKNLPYQHYVFTLKVPIVICVERNGKREKSYGKEAAIAVHKLVSRFDYGIVIDISKKTIDESVKKILSHLPKPL